MTNLDSILKKKRHYFANRSPSGQSYGFSSSPVWMWELDHKQSWMPRIDVFELWCWIRLLIVPWTARRANQQSSRKSVLNSHWKDWCWSWSSNTLATWCEELTYWKRPWCWWERLKAGGKGDNRGWDGWMVSLTRWTWVWASSRSWWWTGKPAVLQSMGSQRVGHNWATELNQHKYWKNLNLSCYFSFYPDLEIIYFFCFSFLNYI